MNRKLAGFAAAAVLLSGAFAPAAFAATSNPYTDVTSSNYAYQDILTLTADGYIHGYSDGQFRPFTPVTRGQFLAYFMNLTKSKLGVSPHATKVYFRDVPRGNWDYNYVGAAEQAGWINPYWLNVRVGQDFNENYRASWGDAASFFVAAFEKAGIISSTDGMAPLAYAKKIGLFNGIPSGLPDFQDLNSTQMLNPYIYLSRASAAVVLTNVLNFMDNNGNIVPQGTTVTVTAPNTDIGANSNEQLTVAMKQANGQPFNYGNAPVTYSVVGNPSTAFVSSTGVFVATASGTYQVEATIDGVTSAPFTINVYGQATNIKLSSSSTQLVADGAQSATITAHVVDANGNAVGNFNGTMTFTDTQGWLVGSNGATTNTVTSVPIANGVATIKLQAGQVPGETDTITGTDVVETGSTQPLENNNQEVSQQLTLQSVPQVATSLKIIPSSTTVENNQPTTDPISVQVLDQAGQPMLTGTYPITLSVSGAGSLAAGQPTTVYYEGNGTATDSIGSEIVSNQGQTGAITIQASSPNLQTASATVNAVVVGAPSAIQVAPAQGYTTSFASGQTDEFQISTVDAAGVAVNDTNQPTYTATVLQNNQPVPQSEVSATVDGSIVNVTGITAGTYQLQVTSSDNLTPGTVSFTITPGAAVKAAITTPAAFPNNLPTTIDLPTTDNHYNIVVQAEDANGNAVPQAGIPVTLGLVGPTGANGGELDGSSSSTVTLDTNSEGQVVVPFSAYPQAGDSWTVNVTQVGTSAVTSGTPGESVSFEMTYAVPTSMTIGLQDVGSSIDKGSSAYATAGDLVNVTITTKNSANVPYSNGDVIEVTLPAGFVNPSGLTSTTTANVYTAIMPSDGTLTFTATAAQAGAQTIQVQDLSTPSPLQASASMNITAGPAVGAAFFTMQGQEITAQNPLSLTANVPTEVMLEPVDAYGNHVTEGQSPETFNLTSSVTGVDFRSTESGSGETQLQLPAGSYGVPVFVVSPTTNTDVVLSAALATS
jgi:hypothetical protein